MTRKGKATARSISPAGRQSPAHGHRRYGWIPLALGLTCYSAMLSQAAHASVANLKPQATQQTEQSEDGQSAAETHAEDVRKAVERIFDEPLSGVVVNRTVTVLGKEFYRHFSTLWRNSAQSNRYSISIHERPSARFGSEVWILYRQQRIFHTFLPPARPATREVSEYAVEFVLENLARRELERFTAPDPDLGPEEL